MPLPNFLCTMKTLFDFKRPRVNTTRSRCNQQSDAAINKTIYTFQLYKFNEVKPANCKSEQIPEPRSGHRVVCNAHNFFSHGGYSTDHNEHVYSVSDGKIFSEIWRFNFATRKWKLYPQRRPIPRSLAWGAVCYDGLTLTVYGGSGLPLRRLRKNRVYIAQTTDPENFTGMVELSVTGDLPEPLFGQALFCHKGYLYTIGGTTGYDYTCDIHRLNLKTNVWETVYIDTGSAEYSPEGRYRHELAFDGSNIYILGGGTVVKIYDFEFIPTFNIRSRTWSKTQTYQDSNKNGIPAPRMCHTCVQYKNSDNNLFVFMVGGYRGHCRVYNDLWRLDLQNFQWSCISEQALPVPVFYNSGAVTPYGKIYIFGGITRKNRCRINTIHSSWITIPKLSEMCWEAILYYWPHVTNLPTVQLLEIGIPVNFITRIGDI